MSDWSWEFMADAAEVVAGLPPSASRQVEVIARRLTDAASVKYSGEPSVEESGVSRLQSFAEGPWIVWFMEHQRWRTVLITRITNPWLEP
ncbi:hypothetical protein ACFY41_16660 [Streptomyces syringium]|uniref:hypothetical protein n=1 Tax=Streptomyces syringium TaxID=76729 RepID=UPI0036C778AD